MSFIHKLINANPYILLILFALNLQVFSVSDTMYNRINIVKARINKNQWALLQKEEENSGMDLFSKQKVGDSKWDVTFQAWPDTIEMLKKHSIKYDLLVQDLGSVTTKDYRKRITNNQITFEEFLTLDEIYSYLNDLSKLTVKNKKISVESIGKTVENRDIMMVKIEPEGASYTVVFDAGIHAREWLSVMQAMYLIKQVIAEGPESKLNRMNWYIIPSLNPDGYVFSHSKGNRLQRKNMNQKDCPEDCGRCGVDLNRNFGFKFGGANKSPCGQTYGGNKAFSEPESRALRDVLEKHAKNIKLYLTLHTFGWEILYPWGYAALKCDDWQDLRDAAVIAKEAIEKQSKNGTKYTVGNTGSDFYPAAGGSDDYAKHLGIKYSYTMELQGGGQNGFDLPDTSIKPFVQENFAGIAAMVEYIDEAQSAGNILIIPTKSGNLYVALLAVFWIIKINRI